MRSEIRLELERDTEGAVETAKVTWGENHPATEKFLARMALGTGLFGLPTLLVLPAVGLVLLAIGGFMFWSALRVPQKPRALIFAADGRMLTPNGIAYHDAARSLKARQDDVVSFEARQMRGEKDAPSEVLMITEEGSMVHLSINMDEEDAFKVAVTLTRGLDALRRAAASGYSEVLPAA